MGKKNRESDLSFFTMEQLVEEMESRSDALIFFQQDVEGNHHFGMKGNKFWTLGVLAKMLDDVKRNIGDGTPWAEDVPPEDGDE